MREGRWAKFEFTSYLLRGKVLGVIGVGNIGSQVAELGTAWGMQVVGCVEHPSLARKAVMAAKGIRLIDLDEVISAADYLSVHVPLKASTRGLINASLLCRVRPGAFLVNLARGGVVDEQALCEALTTGGRLRGAALDVHEQEGEGKLSPLAELTNVILTPHVGAMTIDTQHEIGQLILAAVETLAERCSASVPSHVKVHPRPAAGLVKG
jgi:phosphoglycerate dehydrogenase-like enzyme